MKADCQGKDQRQGGRLGGVLLLFWCGTSVLKGTIESKSCALITFYVGYYGGCLAHSGYTSENQDIVPSERQAAQNGGLRGRKIQQKLSPAIFSCMTLGNSAKLMELQFPRVYDGNPDANLASFL